MAMNRGARDLGLILGMPKENIHHRSAYIGGKLGGKATAQMDRVMAARVAGRPGAPAG